MYYCSGKSLAVIVDCSAQTFNDDQRLKKQKTQERLFRKETVNNFPVYKAKMNQHSSTKCSFSNSKLKKNTMTHARTSGVQEAAFILQKE